MGKNKLVPFIALEPFINGVHPVNKGDVVHFPEGTVWEGKIAPYVPSDNPAPDAFALELAERDARIAELEEQVAARDADIKAALEAATLAQGPDNGAAALKEKDATIEILEARVEAQEKELAHVKAALDEASTKLAAAPAAADAGNAAPAAPASGKNTNK